MSKFEKITPKQIRVLTGEGRPVVVDDHISLGPFVRISREFKNPDRPTYLYVSAFFNVNIGVKGPDFRCEKYLDFKDGRILNIVITPEESKKFNGLKDENQCLTMFVFDLGQLEKETQINVVVNFNHKLKEPTRGTIVIPPGSTIN